ncbi:MAG: PHP domain-containing protein [Bacteroidales bacterium]
MKTFRADLHVHTVLSPCGDLEMSPVNIVEAAVRRNIDILGIADHNSTLNAAVIHQLAAKKGIFTLCGAEVTTKEEAHCLAFFEDFEKLGEFQQYLEAHLPPIKNNPATFGYQVVVDEHDQIIRQVEHVLISAIGQTIDQVQQKVHSLNGLFIPAHIDRPRYSLTSQLGFVPPDIRADALEISRFTTVGQMIEKYPYLKGYSFITSSDAHFPHMIGERFTVFQMQQLSFEEIRMALHHEQNRKVTFPANDL